MKEFHGYYLKIYDYKTEIYKNSQFVASEDDEEKAKSLIINELEKEKENEEKEKEERE